MSTICQLFLGVATVQQLQAQVNVFSGASVRIEAGGLLEIGAASSESSPPAAPPPTSPPPPSPAPLWPQGYAEYVGRACSGRNELFTSPLQASAHDCKAHCDSVAACISVEWQPSSGKCYGSSSCTHELSFDYPLDTLYVKYDPAPPPPSPPGPPVAPPSPPGPAGSPAMAMVYSSGTSASNSPAATGTVDLVVGAAYSVAIEVLRNDLGGQSEKITAVYIGSGSSLGECNPDGDDYDCTFFACTHLTMTSFTPTTSAVALRIDATGHSHDCDCDINTWQCSQENTVSGRIPMTAVARFSFTAL